jgi:chorismate synthase
MATLSYRTAGESHGKALITLVEGMPAGVRWISRLSTRELRRRQGGYGRGGRRRSRPTRSISLTGVRMGKTIGSPIAMLIPNKDSRLDDPPPPAASPRPGHAIWRVDQVADDRLPGDARARHRARDRRARRRLALARCLLNSSASSLRLRPRVGGAV